MRYYLYISDAKVDMLLPQVPGVLQKKVAAELGFDIKLLSGKISTERATLDTRVARLQTVEAHLLAEERLGTPDRPASWIEGELLAKTVDIGEGAVLFVSEAESWLLALGGSSHHIVGNIRGEKVISSYSFAPYLAERLKFLTEKKPHFLLKFSEESPRNSLSSKSQGFDAWTDLIWDVCRHAKGPSQAIHFLAKRLASEVAADKTVTLATPLYVSLVE